MRKRIPPAILIVVSPWIAGWAIGFDAVAVEAPAVSLPAITFETPPSKFSEEQVRFVQSWIQDKAPECPLDVRLPAATRMLQELRQRHPDKLDRLLAADFPARDFESTLLRCVGAELGGATQSGMREEIARRRVQAVLAGEGGPAATAPQAAAALVAKIRDMSQVFHRRLLEGRMEDDDLVLLLKKARQGDTPAPALAPAKPKELTAKDIVSEFSRRNQAGTALQRLRAFTVEGQLRTAEDGERSLRLFRLRPDRFRMTVLAGGITRYTLAFDGQRYWQQGAGQPPQEIGRDAIGQRRYLAEFVDPLFGEERYGYEKLEDGLAEQRKFFRIAVKRLDGSTYVARIDPETFRQIGRENEDRSTAFYSDFREVAGITIPFREEAIDQKGVKSVFEVTRFTANPGLIQVFFQPPERGAGGHFDFERIFAAAPPPSSGVKQR